jgi:O-antigen ligase
VGFYGFLLLEPEWNWRWSLPPDVPYQQYVFAATCAGFVLNLGSVQRLSRKSKYGLWAIIGFLSIAWLSSHRSVDPISTDFFMDIVWKQFLVLGLGIVLLDSPQKIKTLMVVVVLAQGYNAFQINLDYFQTGVSRFAYSKWGVSGADNNGYSIITIPLLAITLSLAMFEARLWVKGVFLAVGMLQIHQFMLLESRGGMLAGIAMIALLVWKMPRRNGNIPIAVACGLLAAALAGPSVISEFQSAFADEGERDSSAESRFYLWRAGWRITWDHPILGVGPNAARVLVPQPQYYDGGLDTENKALHNLFFDVSTGTGVPGFTLYFGLLLLPFVIAAKTYDQDDTDLGAPRLAVAVGIPGYLIASMFSSGLLFESCYVLVMIGYCVSNIDGRKSRVAVH